MKLVRRARKSIRERRMKACMNDLNSNLSKIEMRVFSKQKNERIARHKESGVPNSVPISVLQGKMTPELYIIECHLHEEAGLAKPRPYPEYQSDIRKANEDKHRVGFLSFATIVTAIRRINSKA
ncbi:unnamed protein product [Phytomonas sp. Hart1]|nr:unnamed protein product [Phytomonas sp. Hart1]|eukprot:CCW66737.1 unnamed protein product [Phytomonas sp. isolate Hart1]